MNSASGALVSAARQLLKEIKYAPVEKMIRSLAPKGRRAGWLSAYLGWRRARQPQLSAQLQAVLDSHPDARLRIVFTPSLDWQKQLFQRPQQLAQALAQRGALVFYMQITPLPGAAQIVPVRDRLYLCALPLEQFSALKDYFVYTLTWNRKYLLKLNQPYIHYDYLDEIAAFEGDRAQLAKDHRALLRDAHLITATARELLSSAQATRPDALYVPNGADFAHFHGVPEQQNPPPEMESLRGTGKPLIGFYGAFAGWFDYDLMRDLAVLRPDLNFVLIGPKHDGSLDASGLLNIANVHYLGPKPYADLPAYLRCFDAAILPFKVNQITQATSPIKLFEYFAGGKAVIATPLKEVMQYDAVLIAADAPAFADKIDAALSQRNSIALINRLHRVAQENTWEMRAEIILQAMEQILANSKSNQTER